jgi:Bacterial RNA polymerase, alpha chain C terminal domain
MNAPTHAPVGALEFTLIGSKLNSPRIPAWRVAWLQPAIDHPVHHHHDRCDGHHDCGDILRDHTPSSVTRSKRPPHEVRRLVTGTGKGLEEKLRWQRNQMISDHGPGLPDDAPIDQVRLPTRIRRALALAGLNTVGDIRRTSDAVLLSLPNIGQSSVTHLRNELGSHNRA